MQDRTTRCRWPLLAAAIALTLPIAGWTQGRVTSPKEQFGFNICDDYHLVTYKQFSEYWKKLDTESDRVQVVSIGKSEKGLEQWMAIVTSPANFAKLERYRDISEKLSRARSLTDDAAKALAKEGRAVVWIDGGLHANELLGAQQLVEHVYRMASQNDDETVRILNDVVQLVVLANPDGLELLATAYMKNSDPKGRSMGMLPEMYHKYIGHDNNRDFYMNAMSESKNMSRVMYRQWYPQIMYNHHQSGPAGSVMFAPPFRAPHNYNLDPILMTSLNSVGDAMQGRFASEGKPGVVMREAANFQTWWNGGLRTTSYFHNQIGILTETVGGPSPMQISVVPSRLTAESDSGLYPIMPQELRFRTSMEYEITANMAILNYASRMREELLYNIYLMGRNSIKRGNEDTWTIHERSIAKLKEEQAKVQKQTDGKKPTDLETFQKVLRNPDDRDPRGYVLPADQADFLTATKFVNALIESGIEISYATKPFSIKDKRYPAGSYVIKSAQPFRPHVLDMLEPQFYPREASGKPTSPPYDSAGYTLALQMGVKFDRILEGFECPCTDIKDVLKKPPVEVKLPKASGYLLSRKINDSYRAVNRLTKERQTVMAAGQNFYVPATAKSTEILNALVEERGLPVQAATSKPSNATTVKPYKIGLYDYFGGSMESGWTRWLLEQFEFPFEVVYAPMLDNDDLSKYAALVFVGGGIPGYSATPQPAQTAEQRAKSLEKVPAEYHRMYGSTSQATTMPKLKTFVERGGRIIAIGGAATSLAQQLSMPIADHLTEPGENGPQRIPSSKFNVPTSLLDVTVDNTVQGALGMDTSSVVVFDGSPVMRLLPSAAAQGIRPLAWYSKPDALRSGWMLGGGYLVGGVAVAQAKYGEGTVYLCTPEIAFRAQPHGTFKFLFNGIVGE